jgi:PHS family inorganic phosphate transporter-like MFS transporter
MLQYRLYGGKDLPAGLQGFLKGMLFVFTSRKKISLNNETAAGANIGSVIGQFLFGEIST